MRTRIEIYMVFVLILRWNDGNNSGRRENGVFIYSFRCLCACVGFNVDFFYCVCFFCVALDYLLLVAVFLCFLLLSSPILSTSPPPSPLSTPSAPPPPRVHPLFISATTICFLPFSKSLTYPFSSSPSFLSFNNAPKNPY